MQVLLLVFALIAASMANKSSPFSSRYASTFKKIEAPKNNPFLKHGSHPQNSPKFIPSPKYTETQISEHAPKSNIDSKSVTLTQQYHRKFPSANNTHTPAKLPIPQHVQDEKISSQTRLLPNTKSSYTYESVLGKKEVSLPKKYVPSKQFLSSQNTKSKNLSPLKSSPKDSSVTDTEVSDSVQHVITNKQPNFYQNDLFIDTPDKSSVTPAQKHARVPKNAITPNTFSLPSYQDASQYTYQYTVKDDYSKVNYGAAEERKGNAASGSYYIALPDGRLQKVTYYVRGDGGFVAEVTYEGEAKFPEEKPAAALSPSYRRSQFVHSNNAI